MPSRPMCPWSSILPSRSMFLRSYLIFFSRVPSFTFPSFRIANLASRICIVFLNGKLFAILKFKQTCGTSSMQKEPCSIVQTLCRRSCYFVGRLSKFGVKSRLDNTQDHSHVSPKPKEGGLIVAVLAEEDRSWS